MQSARPAGGSRACSSARPTCGADGRPSVRVRALVHEGGTMRAVISSCHLGIRSLRRAPRREQCLLHTRAHAAHHRLVPHQHALGPTVISTPRSLEVGAERTPHARATRVGQSGTTNNLGVPRVSDHHVRSRRSLLSHRLTHSPERTREQVGCGDGGGDGGGAACGRSALPEARRGVSMKCVPEPGIPDVARR